MKVTCWRCELKEFWSALRKKKTKFLPPGWLVTPEVAENGIGFNLADVMCAHCVSEFQSRELGFTSVQGKKGR